MEVPAKTGSFIQAGDGPNCAFNIKADTVTSYVPSSSSSSSLPTYNLKTSYDPRQGVVKPGFVQDIQSMSNVDFFYHPERIVPIQFEIVTPLDTTSQSFTARILDAQLLEYLIMTSTSASPKDVSYSATLDRENATVFKFRVMGKGQYACTINTFGVEMALVYGQIIDQSTLDTNTGTFDTLNATVYGKNGLGMIGPDAITTVPSASFITYPVVSSSSSNVQGQIPQLVYVIDKTASRALLYDPTDNSLTLIPYPFAGPIGTAFSLTALGSNYYNLGVPGVMSLVYSSPTGSWIPDANGQVRSLLIYNPGAPTPQAAIVPPPTSTSPVPPFSDTTTFAFVGNNNSTSPLVPFMFRTINTSPILQVKIMLVNDATHTYEPGYEFIKLDPFSSYNTSEDDATILNVVFAASDNTKYTLFDPNYDPVLDLGYNLNYSTDNPSALSVQEVTTTNNNGGGGGGGDGGGGAV